MFGIIDDQVFVILVGQRRIKLGMAAIERGKEQRPFGITLRPYIVAFASVLVLIVRPSGSITFFFIEVFRFVIRKFINDTPNIFRLIWQDIGDATTALGILNRECQPGMRVVLPGKQTLLTGIVA